MLIHFPKDKKIPKLFCLFMAIGWIVFSFFYISNTFRRDAQSMMARILSDTRAEQLSAEVEICAACPDASLTKEAQQALLYMIAEKLALTVEESPVYVKTPARSELSYTKDAKAAKTELRVVGLTLDTQEGETVRGFVSTKLHFYETTEHLMTYYRLLREIYTQLELQDISCTLKVSGMYTGTLDSEEKADITKKMLALFDGEEVYRHEEKYYTVYAYTDRLEESVRVGTKQINLHILFDENDTGTVTVVYVASPLLTETW